MNWKLSVVIKSPTLKTCCKCNQPAKIYDNGKYYCAFDKYKTGYCKNKE